MGRRRRGSRAGRSIPGCAAPAGSVPGCSSGSRPRRRRSCRRGSWRRERRVAQGGLVTAGDLLGQQHPQHFGRVPALRPGGRHDIERRRCVGRASAAGGSTPAPRRGPRPRCRRVSDRPRRPRPPASCSWRGGRRRRRWRSSVTWPGASVAAEVRPARGAGLQAVRSLARCRPAGRACWWARSRGEVGIAEAAGQRRGAQRLIDSGDAVQFGQRDGLGHLEPDPPRRRSRRPRSARPRAVADRQERLPRPGCRPAGSAVAGHGCAAG